MSKLVEQIYEKHQEVPPRLRRQSIWRFSPESVAEVNADEEFRRAGNMLFPGHKLLGHLVTVRTDIVGFYLDGRAARPSYHPKMRAAPCIH